MNIDEMPTGPEMNGLMATEVMGWHREGCNWCDAQGRWMAYADDVFREPAWSPYNNIAHAWEIAEKLRMTITPNIGHPCARWCADIELKGGDDIWLAGAKTVELAICHAAFKVITLGLVIGHNGSYHISASAGNRAGPSAHAAGLAGMKDAANHPCAITAFSALDTMNEPKED